MTTRWDDAVRFRFEGDTLRAQQYIPQARVLLGEVIATKGYAGLEVLARQITLHDGTRIRAISYPGHQELEISVPVASSSTPPKVTQKRPVKKPRLKTVCERLSAYADKGLLYGPVLGNCRGLVASPRTGEAFFFYAYQKPNVVPFMYVVTLVAATIDGELRYLGEYEQSGYPGSHFGTPTGNQASVLYNDPTDFDVGGATKFTPDYRGVAIAGAYLDVSTRTVRFDEVNAPWSNQYFQTVTTYYDWWTGTQWMPRDYVVYYPIWSEWLEWVYNDRDYSVEIVPSIPPLSSFYETDGPGPTPAFAVSRNQLGGGHWFDNRNLRFDGIDIPVPVQTVSTDPDWRAGGHGLGVYCPPTANVWILGNADGHAAATFDLLYIYSPESGALTQARMPWEGVTVAPNCIAVDLDTGAVVIYDQSTRRLIAFNVPNCWDVRDTISTPALNIPPNAFGEPTVDSLAVARGNVYLQLTYPSQANEFPGHLTALYGVHVPALAVGAVLYSEIPEPPEET